MSVDFDGDLFPIAFRHFEWDPCLLPGRIPGKILTLLCRYTYSMAITGCCVGALVWGHSGRFCEDLRSSERFYIDLSVG